jgi:putative membrane protein
MRLTRLQYPAVISAAVALSLIGCVRQRSGSTSGSSEYNATGDSTHVNQPSTAGEAAATYTDAQIAYLLDEANMADSAAGAYAMNKTNNKDVKGFAKDMMKDHHDLRQQGQDWAKKNNVTPQAPSNDPVSEAGKKEMEALGAAGAGPAFDRAYIDQEVGIHTAVLGLAQQFRGTTQNKDLQDLLDKAAPVIQRHLDKALDIQKKMTPGTTD